MATTHADRIRAHLVQLATAGLDVRAFTDAALALLVRAVPFDSACMATADPATNILTGTTKWGELGDASDEEWARFEYLVPDVYDFRDVAQRPGQVTSLRVETGDHAERSARFRRYLRPAWGFRDELRAALRADDGNVWGYLALYRHDDSAFTLADQQFVSVVAPLLAVGLRAGLLATAVTEGALDAPVVLIVDGDGQIVQAGPGAEELAADLGAGPLHGSLLPVALRALTQAARSGRPAVPRTRLRTLSGQWLVAHAAPLRSRDGSTSDIVVTIEEARPPEIVPLVIAAFGLTRREQDVVRLVLQGLDTGQIAATLHLSAHTVQDHLKIIFDKTGVRSRRELTAKVFYDQYAPRMNGRLAPNGWFAEASRPVGTPAGSAAEPGSPTAPAETRGGLKAVRHAGR
ncbi:LuxR C-terminal-related transcriptional regulator [Streptosporangium oxazolinicum]|uniref:LuxR C-terminal-related transcriptional regulator n=1 Tax=Streptosporangium oxazolinicum TaxID=909287 RepID=A0ABP8AFL5_9ACTN